MKKTPTAPPEPTYADSFAYVETNGAWDSDGRFTVDATTPQAYGMIVGCLAPFRELPADGPHCRLNEEPRGRVWTDIAHHEKYTPKTGTPEFHAWKALQHCKSEIIGPGHWRYTFDAEGMRHYGLAACGGDSSPVLKRPAFVMLKLLARSASPMKRGDFANKPDPDDEKFTLPSDHKTIGNYVHTLIEAGFAKSHGERSGVAITESGRKFVTDRRS